MRRQPVGEIDLAAPRLAARAVVEKIGGEQERGHHLEIAEGKAHAEPDVPGNPVDGLERVPLLAPHQPLAEHEAAARARDVDLGAAGKPCQERHVVIRASTARCSKAERWIAGGERTDKGEAARADPGGLVGRPREQRVRGRRRRAARAGGDEPGLALGAFRIAEAVEHVGIDEPHVVRVGHEQQCLLQRSQRTLQIVRCDTRARKRDGIGRGSIDGRGGHLGTGLGMGRRNETRMDRREKRVEREQAGNGDRADRQHRSCPARKSMAIREQNRASSQFVEAIRGIDRDNPGGGVTAGPQFGCGRRTITTRDRPGRMAASGTGGER